MLASTRPFEPGEKYSPAFCREALALAAEEPERFRELARKYSKTVSDKEIVQSMYAWGISL